MCEFIIGIAGAREFVRVNRNSAPDDLLNSAIGGFGCGAILGRLQGHISRPFDACTCTYIQTRILELFFKYCRISINPYPFPTTMSWC